MKYTGIFIDYSNKEQVKWWNNIASKLVRVVSYSEMIETATNKPVGALFNLSGLLKNYVIKENEKFLDNPVDMAIK